MKTLNLNEQQLQALLNLLVEESQRMDDDGCEGAFDASALSGVYKEAMRAQRSK